MDEVDKQYARSVATLVMLVLFVSAFVGGAAGSLVFWAMTVLG